MMCCAKARELTEFRLCWGLIDGEGWRGEGVGAGGFGGLWRGGGWGRSRSGRCGAAEGVEEGGEAEGLPLAPASGVEAIDEEEVGAGAGRVDVEEIEANGVGCRGCGGEGAEGAGDAEAGEEAVDSCADGEALAACVEFDDGGAEEEDQRDADEEDPDGDEERAAGSLAQADGDGDDGETDDECGDGPAGDDPDGCWGDSAREGDGVGVEARDDPPSEAFAARGRWERSEGVGVDVGECAVEAG